MGKRTTPFAVNDLDKKQKGFWKMLKTLENNPALDDKLISDIVNNLDSMIYIIEKDTYRLKFCNDTVKQKLPDIKMGDKCHKAFYNSDSPCRLCPIRKLKTKAKRASSEIYNPYLELWNISHCASTQWTDGTEVYLMTAVDNTQAKQREQLVEKMTYYDKLLSIPNRDMLIKIFDRAISSRESFSGSIILVGISDFKFFNDTFGHEFGDKLLKRVLESIHRLPLRGEVFRVGSYEFAVMLPGYDLDNTRELAEKIIERFSRPVTIEGVEYSCIINVGMIMYPEHICDTEGLLVALDYTLLGASGKDTGPIIFDNSAKNRLSRKARIVEALKNAVKNDGFEVYYQPIFNVKEGKFTKAEALLRLNDPDLGAISPTEFIPIAEETGLILDMGIMVIEKACETIRDMLAMGVRIDSIDVNVSVVQFIHENFVSSVREILHKYRIPLNFLGFEITESVLISSFDTVKEIMSQFNDIGINFSLDDFGTGYSSICYLIKLPLSLIKLDREFIKNITTCVDNRIIVESIVEMTRKLGFQVVAEGVEEEPQLEMLKGLNCNYIQGFLYSKPLPKNDFIRYMIAAST